MKTYFVKKIQFKPLSPALQPGQWTARQLLTKLKFLVEKNFWNDVLYIQVVLDDMIFETLESYFLTFTVNILKVGLGRGKRQDDFL